MHASLANMSCCEGFVIIVVMVGVVWQDRQLRAEEPSCSSLDGAIQVCCKWQGIIVRLD